MVPRVVTETEEILFLIDALRSSIQLERRCVTDEREAFDALRSRLESIETTEPDRTDVPQSLRLAQTSGLDRVRDAYESTVMSTPHYDPDYDDTYEQSVAEEFGPEVGLLLTEGTWFDQQLKAVVLDKIQGSRQQRDELLRTLEIESDSVDSIENNLLPLIDELHNFAPECSAKQSYGALEAEWTRLESLSEKIDQIASDRQQSIKRQRNVLELTPNAPDIPTYLYHDFENKYPLLSALVNIQSTIETYRSERKHTLCEL